MEVDVIGNNGDGFAIASGSDFAFAEQEVGVVSVEEDVDGTICCFQAVSKQFETVVFADDEVTGTAGRLCVDG